MVQRIALLIDAENGTLPIVDDVILQLEQFGEIVMKRAYGDFSQSSVLSKWKAVCLTNNITIVHHFTCKTQKNSSDILLTVDVMDLLYQEDIDIFCIVSSDSDFGSLVRRLKNAKKSVVGAGTIEPNELYRKLFDHFFYIPVVVKDELSKEQMIIKAAYEQCADHFDKNGFVDFSRFLSNLDKNFFNSAKQQNGKMGKWLVSCVYLQHKKGSRNYLVKPSF